MGYRYEITTTRGTTEVGDVHEEHVGAQGAAETAIFQMDWASVRIVDESELADEDVPVTFYVLRERGGERRYLSDLTGACLERTPMGALRFPHLVYARDVHAQLPDLEIRRVILRSEAV